MNGNDLTDLITEYYTERNLKFPNFRDALAFVQTELGEVYELDLARVGGWKRNNPQNKPTFSKEELGRELGDAIMMLIVAGLAEGVDPLLSLENKIKSKMNKETKSELKSATFTTGIEEVKDGD